MSKRKKGPWYAIYRQVLPTLDAYDGRDSINLLVQKLAEEHSYEPKVLSRMIRAGRFLDRLVGPLTPDDVRGGYAHIEYIQRLYELEPEEASSLVGMAISKKVTLEALQAIIDKYSDRLAQSDSGKRSKARTLISEHDRNTVVALTLCGTEFFGISSGEIVRVERSDVLGQFFIVTDQQGRSSTAIFSRLGDTSRKAIKAAAELLKLAKTARSYFDQVWFVFPESSELVHEFAFLANEESLFRSWLHLSTLVSESDGLALREVTSLRHALSRVMEDGADPLAWSGHPLHEIKPALHGTLIKSTYTFTAVHRGATIALVTDMPAETLKSLIGDDTSVDVVYEKDRATLVRRAHTV